MNIHEIGQKIKSYGVGDHFIIIILILVVTISAFMLGRLAVSPQHKNIPYVNILTPNEELVHCSQ